MSSTIKGGRRHHKRSAHKKSHQEAYSQAQRRAIYFLWTRPPIVYGIVTESRRKSSPQEAPQAFRSQEVSQEAFSQTQRWGPVAGIPWCMNHQVFN